MIHNVINKQKYKKMQLRKKDPMGADRRIRYRMKNMSTTAAAMKWLGQTFILGLSVCVVFTINRSFWYSTTLNRSFYPSTSSTASVRADSSTKPRLKRYY